jgi:hypothetical protein
MLRNEVLLIPAQGIDGVGDVAAVIEAAVIAEFHWVVIQVAAVDLRCSQARN